MTVEQNQVMNMFIKESGCDIKNSFFAEKILAYSMNINLGVNVNITN